MVFSVPMRTGLGYRYYRSRSAVVPVWNHAAPWGQLGMPIEEALPRLPRDAVYVGQGPQARGMIALGNLTPSTVTAVQAVGVAAVAAFCVWALFWPSKKGH